VRAAALLACVLAGCGSAPVASPPPSAVPSTAAPSASCERVVLGFRGQGQPPGLGREVGQVARGLGGRAIGVRYPSGSSAYDADVAAGVRAGARAMRAACGPVTLVGYSQGAEIVHRLVAAHPEQVALAVLMGDPLRAAGSPALTLGTGRLEGRGNAGPGPRLPAGVRVLEVCVQGDDVCNAPLTGRVGPPSQTHRTAYEMPDAVRAVVRAAN
jgi:pimeloyl-ACP methyl ester carboxylesterase